MMKKFILYIVFVCLCFNSLNCFANNKVSETKNVVEYEYTINDFTQKINTSKPQKAVIKSSSSIGGFLMLPFLIDRIYEGEDIHNDVTPLLRLMYPTTDEKTLSYTGELLKAFVIIKREYKKVLNKLEYAIKAKKILPKDAPIIAKKGEYVKEDEVLTQTSSKDEYKITNNLHKYLEYDQGELGEPVRMRDKNYDPTPDVDELALAILNFDIKKIKESIEKMPKYNDGSAEKPYIGDKGLRARILLDTSKPGDKETILGVIDIKVPDGYYINGDTLNKNAKIIFNLKEIEDEDLNIKDYQFFKPLAYGFEKNGIATRALFDRVLLPFVINRKDTNKKMIINGDLFFELCKIDGECERVKTEHGITLKDTLVDEDSIYYNYVTQAHIRLPQEELKFAKINNVIYDANKKELRVFVKHDKSISNIAVMVEDEKSTNFLNPRYEINKNESVAIFDVSFISKNKELSDLGISVSLDDKYFFRSIKNISDDIVFDDIYALSWLDFFLWGLVTSILPGIFFIVLKLNSLLLYKKEKIKIFIRYIFSFIISLVLGIKILNHNIESRYFYFVISAIFVEVSLLFSILGYMDFSLFRPFRKILKHGYVLGVFTSLLFIGFPFCGKEFVLHLSSLGSLNYRILYLFSFILGTLLLPVLCFSLISRKIHMKIEFKALNAFYGIFYLFICLYFIWNIGGKELFIMTVFGTILLLIIWYYYPILISKFITGKTLSKQNVIKFNKIQNLTSLIIFMIFLSSFIAINMLDRKKVINPSVEETLNVISRQIKENKPVLVAVNTDWNLTGLINKIILKKAEKKGLTVAYIDNYIPSYEGSYWVEKYKKPYSNLYILFSNRHKQGIVLPNKLKGINFNDTVKDFN